MNCRYSQREEQRKALFVIATPGAVHGQDDKRHRDDASRVAIPDFSQG